MRLSRRRLLGTFALSAGAAVLAACGQSASTPAPTSAPAKPAESKPAESKPAEAAKPAESKPAAPAAAGAATAAPAAAAPAKPADSGPVTINVIAWNSGSSAEAFKNAMAGINDKFKATKPNVTINFEPLGQGATWTNAQMSRIAGQTADVTATYGFAPQDIINFQPDNQFIDLTGLDSLKNFDPTNVQRFMTWKGKVWQMTLSYVGHIVWTNEDMLAKYNLKAPTTYAEWNAMCETLKSNKETPIFYAAKPTTALSRLPSLIEMNVGRPKHPNFWTDLLVTGKADFTTPEWVESFKRAKEFTKTQFDPSFSGIDYPTGAGIFATGKYAMWPEGSFSGGDIMAAKPTFQKLGAFNGAFSDNAADNAVQPVYGDLGWAGLRYSKSADVVKDWINFFGQKENFLSFMQVLQYYPTQTDAKLTGPVPEAEAPLLKKTAVSQVRLALPGMIYDNQWNELILGDYTPEAYAAYVQKSFDDSKPQWQKHIGLFDADWAKLYFS